MFPASDFEKKRQNSQSSTSKIVKKKSMLYDNNPDYLALREVNAPAATNASANTSMTPGNNNNINTNSAANNSNNLDTYQQAFNGVSGSGNLAETLQHCYTGILKLEKKNHQYNNLIHQSICQLSAFVKTSLNYYQNDFRPQAFITSDSAKLIAERHIAIQKILATAYTNNLELLDSYYDFILYSLRGGNITGSSEVGSNPSIPSSSGNVNNTSSNVSSISAGYSILQVYKICRRLWIYGIINLLENMKNFITVTGVIPTEIFEGRRSGTQSSNAPIENELCINFISHCFSLLSTFVEMNNNLSIEVDTIGYAGPDHDKVIPTINLISEFQSWWYEKIADLSRMSIALYPTSFIDWEVSAEYWYLKAVGRNYGHGKTYYHLATVQSPTTPSDHQFSHQDHDNYAAGNLNASLEALFNLGKSVFVKECFVPTGHYLRSVLDSMFSNLRISSNAIYESSLVHLTSGNGNIIIDKNKVTTVDNLANWELIILQYIRVCKVLLVNNFNSSPDLIKLVSQFSRIFGSIDFVSDDELSSFNEFSSNNGLNSANPSNLNGSPSVGSPMNFDPFGNEASTPFSHSAIRVSFFEKNSASLGFPGTCSATRSMIIDKPSMKLLNFWFNKSGNLASINIWQLVGFGVVNFKNLFSILFGLPVSLKERHDKKENKKNRKPGSENSGNVGNETPISASGTPTTATHPENSATDNDINMQPSDSLEDDAHPLASQMTSQKWHESLQYINKSSMELSFRMLRKFLNCPFKSVSIPHVIVWLYFLIAVGEAVEKYPESERVVLGVIFRKFFPWDSLVNYLNFWVNEVRRCFDFDNLEKGFHYETGEPDDFVKQQNLIEQIKDLYSMGHDEYLHYFDENETLIEVWKLWGSLWYNQISEKKNYLNMKSAGWTGKDFLSDYINKTEEKLYYSKPDVNSQDSAQKSHNANNNYFKDLVCECDGSDRTNFKVNAMLHEREVKFERECRFRNGNLNLDVPIEKPDRRLFNSVEKDRIKRILLLGLYISEKFPKFGLRLSERGFKFDASIKSSNANIRYDDKDEEVKNKTLIFEFITDTRFAQLVESISEENIYRKDDEKSDFKFDINMFFRSDANYEFLKAQKESAAGFGEEDEIMMGSENRSLKDLAPNDISMNIPASDMDVESSIMDDNDSFLNYDIARKALGFDTHLISDSNTGVDTDKDDIDVNNKEKHLITPDLNKTAHKISPFELPKPKIELPHVSFVGNITNDIDTSITYITFDTNSWLKNCGKIYKIFKCCSLNKKSQFKLRISLPLLVYQELKSLRKSDDTFLSDSATRCVITIKNIFVDNVGFFRENFVESDYKTHQSMLLLLKPDGSVASSLNDPCEMVDKSRTYKVIDDNILQSVAKASKAIKRNYLTMITEKYMGKVDDNSVLELEDGKKLSMLDLYNFKYNILITDNRPLRLSARKINVNAYQNKWLFYNLERINVDGACID